jgi:hypothetical protein
MESCSSLLLVIFYPRILSNLGFNGTLSISSDGVNWQGQQQINDYSTYMFMASLGKDEPLVIVSPIDSNIAVGTL